MSNHPGIYYDIGRKARDLLYKDYTQQPPIHYHFRCFDWNFDLSCQINNIVPGLGTSLKFIIPYQNKVELRFLQDYVGITAGISLGAKPLVNFSGVLGNGFLSFGTDLSFDAERKTFSKYNAGLSFNTSILVASLTLIDQGDTLRASCYHPVSPLTKTAIAAELKHKLLRNETTFTFGSQLAIFPTTFMKARVSSNGKLGALVQQKLFSSFFVTVAGDVDVRDVMRSAKLGLSLAVRP